MWIDKLAEFTASQALTATAALTDYINLGGDFDIGPGIPIYWNLVVLVAADDTTGDETYVFNLETDDNAAFSSATTIASITVPRGTAAGTKYSISVPMENEQYMRVNAVLGGTTPTVTVESWLGATPTSQQRAYPDAIA